MNNPHHHSHHHKFDSSLKERLDNAAHRKLDAEQVLNFLPLKPADHVADIGAGTGFFTLPLAHRLPRGKVTALDISPDMLARCERRCLKMEPPILKWPYAERLTSRSSRGVSTA